MSREQNIKTGPDRFDNKNRQFYNFRQFDRWNWRMKSNNSLHQFQLIVHWEYLEYWPQNHFHLWISHYDIKTLATPPSVDMDISYGVSGTWHTQWMVHQNDRIFLMILIMWSWSSWNVVKYVASSFNTIQYNGLKWFSKPEENLVNTSLMVTH